MVLFLEYLVFFGAVFCTEQLKMICRMDFDMFFGILIFDESQDFAWAISFAWWPIFKMISFLEYLVFFGAVFCTEQLKMICRMDFDMFFGILIFAPKWRFCMGYRLCIWPIFKMISFLEYLVFFGVVFCTEQLKMICRMDFDMFFGILIFEPKSGFWLGYSLCVMANFENALISRITGVFWSGFFAQNNSKWFLQWIFRCFLEF